MSRLGRNRWVCVRICSWHVVRDSITANVFISQYKFNGQPPSLASPRCTHHKKEPHRVTSLATRQQSVHDEGPAHAQFVQIKLYFFKSADSVGRPVVGETGSFGGNRAFMFLVNALQRIDMRVSAPQMLQQ